MDREVDPGAGIGSDSDVEAEGGMRLKEQLIKGHLPPGVVGGV